MLSQDCNRIHELTHDIYSQACDASLTTTVYDPVFHEILEAYRSPRPADPLPLLRQASGEELRERIHVLQGNSLLVDADQEEPADYNAIFSAAAVLFCIWQHPGEFATALEIIAGVRPRRVLEIGTGSGGTLFSLAQVASPDALLIAVDDGGFGITQAYAQRFAQFCRPSQRLHCIFGDSRRPHVINQVRRSLDGELLDVLFIDGDHSYDAVKRDFDSYHRFVRPGGVIFLHDIWWPQGKPLVKQLGVHVLWRELKVAYPSEEIMRDVEDDEGFDGGIGVLYV